MLINRPLSRNIIIALGLALIIIIALVAAARYFIVRDLSSQDKRAESKQPSQSVPVSEEVLRSLTPPEGAKPAEISKEVSDSITPPKDAKPVAVSQAILDSLTPPANK